MLDRAGDGPLMLGGKPGIFARQNLARVGHETDPRLRRREGNFRGSGSLLLLFGRAHGLKGGRK